MAPPTSDYTATLTDACVFDLSDRGQIELTGPDAASFLHNLCTNDIKNLAVGASCEFFLTTHKAKVVGHGFARRLPESLWLDVDPGTGAKVAAHLNRFVVSEQVEIYDRTGTARLRHVAGPRAVEHAPHGVVRQRVNLPGVDVLGEGEPLPVAVGTPATFDLLRIEAGIPIDGVDMDAERFVVEVGRIKEAICYTKGCYLGQEPIVMARDRGHANRALLGLVMEGAEPVARGAKLLRGGEEIGLVTSSVWSPAVGSPIALAYVKRGHQDAGTVGDVDGRRATVTSLPFGRNAN